MVKEFYSTAALNIEGRSTRSKAKNLTDAWEGDTFVVDLIDDDSSRSTRSTSLITPRVENENSPSSSCRILRSGSGKKADEKSNSMEISGQKDDKKEDEDKAQKLKNKNKNNSSRGSSVKEEYVEDTEVGINLFTDNKDVQSTS